MIYSGEEEVYFKGHQEAGSLAQDGWSEKGSEDPGQYASAARQEARKNRSAGTLRSYAAQDEQIPVRKQKPHPQQITLC